jgi:hypothetical protein
MISLRFIGDLEPARMTKYSFDNFKVCYEVGKKCLRTETEQKTSELHSVAPISLCYVKEI